MLTDLVALNFTYIYIYFFSFFSFCVYVYASLCDFLFIIGLLLPFVLGFCLSVVLFGRIVFSACYHWWICFLVWLLSSFFLCFFFLYYFLIFLIFNNYFLSYSFYYFFLSFFLPFFLPFILCHVDDRILVLWPGVRPVPLRWESRVQDIGPPEKSQLYIISNGKNHPEISISTPRRSFTQWPASYSAGHPMPNN